jgi:xanthine dehydrogenase YagT iron-sulfur-binding subunit
VAFVLRDHDRGLGTAEGLHPLQESFVKADGLQCGFCTPGEICSAVAMLEEHRAGGPSAVTADVTQVDAHPAGHPELAEVRERMSGNLCRCGAYNASWRRSRTTRPRTGRSA